MILRAAGFTPRDSAAVTGELLPSAHRTAPGVLGGLLSTAMARDAQSSAASTLGRDGPALRFASLPARGFRAVAFAPRAVSRQYVRLVTPCVPHGRESDLQAFRRRSSVGRALHS